MKLTEEKIYKKFVKELIKDYNKKSFEIVNPVLEQLDTLKKDLDKEFDRDRLELLVAHADAIEKKLINFNFLGIIISFVLAELFGPMIVDWFKENNTYLDLAIGIAILLLVLLLLGFVVINYYNTLTLVGIVKNVAKTVLDEKRKILH
ncbi:hypothetical protein [Calditerricola satsumensis]|uniref:Uncharacterized protein n=1 Tax=Calditerricola satsumensis TaxID=373054 RepID=A0A8J3F950_9BACI|nr:hypothetical protein [Calditerricola satsumensis]GGJ95820.1 hypothetical protein GCM10007043_06980 [Calditerricola satsumensis]